MPAAGGLPLSPGAIEQIHQNALVLLSETGVRVRDASVRRVLRNAGAIVPAEGDLARFPERMVLDALAVAPRQVSLSGRNGSRLLLAEGHCYHGSADNKLNVFDFPTGRIRRATRQDVVDLTQVAEALPGLSVVMPSAYANDVAAHLSEMYTFAALFTYTAKHCQAAPSSLDEAQTFVELARVAGGMCNGRWADTVSMYVSTLSPLSLDAETAKIVTYAAERRVPLITLSGPIVGVSSPWTLAGTLTIHNAENLFLITLAQAVCPGTPVVYGATVHVGDLRTGGLAVGGGAEYALLNGAVAQLARSYRLPSYAPLHNMVNSQGPGPQAGAMKMLAYFAARAAGLNITIGAGFFAPTITSCEQMIIDEALWQVVDRYYAGIEVNEDTLALDVIRQVGPEGHYLGEDHTLRWMYGTEHRRPQVFDGEWLGKSVWDIAHERADEIRQMQMLAVSPGTISEVQAYVQEREGTRSRLWPGRPIG